MRRAAALTTILLGLSFGAEAAPAEDPTPALKRDVDFLVKSMTDDGGADPMDGASPTARVNRMIAAGEPKLRPVLDEAWRIVVVPGEARKYAAATKQLIRFLWSLAEPGKAAAAGEREIVEEDGVVRVRKGDAAGGFGFGKGGFGKQADDSTPPFAALVKGGKLRKAGKPDVKKVLAALDVGKVADDERVAVAQAVGEACALPANKPAMADLVRRFDADPASPWLTTALGWTGSPDAEPSLRLQVAPLAARVAEGRDAAAPILATLCRALGHLRADAMSEEIGKLTGAPREAVLAAVGLDFALRFDLDAIERATEKPAKDVQLDALCRRITAAPGGPKYSAATTAAVTKLLAARLDDSDAALRASVLDAAETLFYAFNRTAVNDSSRGVGVGGVDVEAKTTGERVGPYPDMARLLASLAKDVEAGDLLFVDGEPSIFELAGRASLGEWPRVKSLVASPDPMSPDRPDPPDALPPTAQIKGEVFGQWLRLSLTNIGQTPITVNPVALRYGTAEATLREIYGGPGVTRKYRQLKLTLGFVRASVATPAARLATLGPNESFPWVVDLREADRKVEHVSVEMFPHFAVRGKPAAPPLTGFAEAWVK